MPLQLPNLDDRRWADMVDEARALLPVYAPEWTDHNVSDPGITLIELFAWLAEMDVFQLSRITDALRLKFLALAGERPRGARAARTVVRFSLPNGGQPVTLPAGLELNRTDSAGTMLPFRLVEPVTVVPSRLAAIQWEDAGQFHNLTTRWTHGGDLPLFGPDPKPGSTLYLGFDGELPVNVPISLAFTLEGAFDRWRIAAEIERQRGGCLPPGSGIDCGTPRSQPDESASAEALPHHSARTVWEAAASGGWQALQPDAVQDDTRAFTVDGRVTIQLGAPLTTPAARAVGAVDTPLLYLRCRLESGMLDAPPRALDISLNGVTAEQAVPLTCALAVRARAPIQGPAPAAGDVTGLTISLDSSGGVTALTFQSDVDPRFRVLDFQAPQGKNEGRLILQAACLGTGSGRPDQRRTIAPGPVLTETLRIFGLEQGAGWREWEFRADFDASGRADARYTIGSGPNGGTQAVFGNGDHGRAVPEGTVLLARALATDAERGNASAGGAITIADSPVNRTLLPNPGGVDASQATESAGGAAQETLDQAVARTLAGSQRPTRAVTLSDYETLARETPGVRLARAAARANLHPGFPCLRAPGNITVLVLPYLPASRPAPSPGVLQAVRSYLMSRRVVGTRVHVAGPVYTEVTVNAQVNAEAGASKAGVADRVAESLKAFFDPIAGGPEGGGWPFGRDVYRSEVMAVIDGAGGVDNVTSLDLFVGSESTCGNVCIGPLGLVASGAHVIEVI